MIVRAGTWPFLSTALLACATVSHDVASPRGVDRAMEDGYRPAALAVGDLDRDGRSDLVAVHPFDGKLSVVTAAGTRTYDAAHQPLGVALTDLNHDGWLDAVFANRKDFLVTVRLGSPNGLSTPVDFEPLRSSANHEWGVGLALGDFDADGNVDVAVGVQVVPGRGEHVAILPGDGTGALGTPRTRLTVNGPIASIATSDLDGDGRLDLVVALDNRPLLVARGTREGSFVPWEWREAEAADARPSLVAVADLDADGRPDVATVEPQRGLLAIYFGLPSGRLGRPRRLLTAFQPSALVVGDVDGDGRTDLLTVSTVEAAVAVSLADGAGGFREAVRIPLCTVPAWPRLEPGDEAIHAAQRDFQTRHAAELRQPPGAELVNWNLFATWLEEVRPLLLPDGVALGDFDGDGRTDLAVADARARRVSVRFATAGTGVLERLAGSCGVRPLRMHTWRASADGLVCAWKDAFQRVQVRETRTGRSRVLNLAPGDPVPDGWSSIPDVSDDGRYILFASTERRLPGAQLPPSPSRDLAQIFLLDRASGQLAVERLDAGSGVEPGLAPTAPRITDGGRYVYFVPRTLERSGVAAPPPRQCGLAIRDRMTQRTLCVVPEQVDRFDVNRDGRVLAWLAPDHRSATLHVRGERGFEVSVTADGATRTEEPDTATPPEEDPEAAGDERRRQNRHIHGIELDAAGTLAALTVNHVPRDDRRATREDLYLLDLRTRALTPVPLEAAIGAPLEAPTFHLERSGRGILIEDRDRAFRYDLELGTATPAAPPTEPCDGGG